MDGYSNYCFPDCLNYRIISRVLSSTVSLVVLLPTHKLTIIRNDPSMSSVVSKNYHHSHVAYNEARFILVLLMPSLTF